MPVLWNVVTVVVVAALVIALWWLAELLQSVLVSRRDAARAALERDHELRLIDDEALANAIRSLDEAA